MLCMKKWEKYGIELNWSGNVYAEFCTVGNKGISIDLLRNAFFYMQNNKNIHKYIVNLKI